MVLGKHVDVLLTKEEANKVRLEALADGTDLIKAYVKYARRKAGLDTKALWFWDA